MRFERVMLVNPKYKGHYPAFLPAGLGYIAEALVHAGIKYDYVDMGLDKSISNLRARILSFSPDLLGLQVMTYGYLHTYDQIRLIKRMFPQLRIVAGGHHISSVREKVLEENEAIDYGIVLEGEQTIVELCSGRLSLAEIKGLIFRQNGKVTYMGDRKFIEDIDALPFPEYKKFDFTRYPSSTIPITSSRGCPYSCTYCPIRLTIGRQMRVRSAANVVDEMEYWHRRGYKRFGFTDDNFTLYKERVYEICDEIERRRLKDIELICGNGVRADKVDRELLVRMREVGFTWLAFGVEAGNNNVLKRIKKGETIEEIEKAISDACELGFDVDLFFIMGSPGETEADIQDSIDLALRYPVASVEFYNIIPFPGTELFDWVKQNDYFVRMPDDYLNDASQWRNEPVFETPELPYESRKRMFKICQKVSKQVRRAYMKRRLSKYGIFGDFMAYVYVTDFVQQRILPNTRLKKLLKKLYSAMTN